jgi:hypothetical protein
MLIKVLLFKSISLSAEFVSSYSLTSFDFFDLFDLFDFFDLLTPPHDSFRFHIILSHLLLWIFSGLGLGSFPCSV